VLPPVALLAARGLLDTAPGVAKWARPARAFAVALAFEWVCAVATQRIIAAWFDAYGPYRALALRLNCEVTPGARLFVVGVPNNVRTQLLYYIRRPTEVVDEPQLLEGVPAKGSEVWVLAPKSARDALDRIGATEVVDRVERLLGHHEEPDRLTLLRLRAG
jgi:hypothetical protein